MPQDADRYSETWPHDGEALLRELSDFPGRLALVVRGPATPEVLAAIAAVANSPVLQIGRHLAQSSLPYSVEGVMETLDTAVVLDALDVLFWKPGLDIDPLHALVRLARHRPIVAAWPGEVDTRARMVRYSRPGRSDFYEAELSDAIILSPRPRRFPDQVPYTLERIPA